MEEYVGKVLLNYKYYSGNDLYSDGKIEDELFEIVRKHSLSDFDKIIASKKNWAILYHLSRLRENIVEWLPINKEETVLEIGSGCGAITGVLAKKAKKVTCIDLSKKRSLINAYRHMEKDNIEIIVGNYQDIENGLNEKYDYITLIGVFEYAQSYITGIEPYFSFLQNIMKHLKDNGKVIIAIENKYGLKYWAGCQEDHVGKYFEGIEGYTTTKGVRTFSKMELEEIAQRVGCNNYEFYYPYPDYKFPLVIYSDYYLPKIGDLKYNMRNFDRERMILFDETKAFDTIINDGLFPLYTNSYLMVIKKGD